MIPHKQYTTIFASSVLSLAELLGLRPDLITSKKVVYFHENQLVYPKQQIKQRDFQYGYNQITTCLAADTIIFNSNYNRNSFVDNITKFLKLMPDFRPQSIAEQIAPKCTVIYFPIAFTHIPITPKRLPVLHIVWPHRWEFDKGPEDFFDICNQLKATGKQFKLSVIGETFHDAPIVFKSAKTRLSEEILNWGYVESKEKYFEVLNDAHVVVSTAKHEFFGVAVLEAVHCGCLPLLPNRLVYPELFDGECLYDDVAHAVKILKGLSPELCKERRENMTINLQNYDTNRLVEQFRKQLY